MVSWVTVQQHPELHLLRRQLTLVMAEQRLLFHLDTRTAAPFSTMVQ